MATFTPQEKKVEHLIQVVSDLWKEYREMQRVTYVPAVQYEIHSLHQENAEKALEAALDELPEAQQAYWRDAAYRALNPA